MAHAFCAHFRRDEVLLFYLLGSDLAVTEILSQLAKRI